MSKEKKSVKSVVGALKFFSNLDKLEGTRKDVFRHENKNWTVDTCKTHDTEKWETGIFPDGLEGDCVIVEQYENREEARKGHERWISLMQDNPKRELLNINVWEL